MAEGVLETRGLTKSFGALAACRDVSLSVKSGEIHALIGPNGAGKSTLIQQIAGGLRPDTGSVYLAGEDVTGCTTTERAQRGLARTFQISALAMEDRVLQNAVLGAIGAEGVAMAFLRPALSRQSAQITALEALERTGLVDKRHVRTSDLSHGERRKLEVAVALTLRPKVFVMDEPMAGLGSSGTEALTQLLGELRSEAPILLVEHDMDAVFALADRISVLVEGQVIASGPVADIRSDPKVQAAYLGEAP